MTTVPFTPSPLAFAENSVLAVLRATTAKGMAHWNFPLNHRTALKELSQRGLITMEETPSRSYKVALTPEGKAALGVGQG